MYGWIWRHLPGPWPVKMLGACLLVALTVAALWYVVFPWAGPKLPLNDVTVQQSANGAQATTPGPGPG